MPKNSRRRFIRNAASGLTASMLFPSLSLEATTEIFDPKRIAFNGHLDKEETWEAVRDQFKFDEGLRYFNNASLGSSSIPIRNATKQYRDTLDDFPSKYMWGAWREAKEETRSEVAQLLGVDSEEIALIHNTTEGMNLIARSFELEPGDEVILADHEHASGRIPWEVWQEEKGIKLVRPTLPILPKSKEELIDVYRDAITDKTKVISMCHIVNTNGMILPVKEVSEMAHQQGILVAVDGAQSAGMIDIDLHDLGCDFYTASAHKWLFSPKGIGVFYAKESSQSMLKPLMVARGHRDSSIRRLENYNTRNLPELLGLGAAVKFLNEIGMGKIHDRSYELKSYLRNLVNNNPKLQLKSPQPDDLSAAIQSVEVVNQNVSDVKRRLEEDYNIDCRPMSSFDLNALRISLAIYITKSDIDYLYASISSIADDG